MLDITYIWTINQNTSKCDHYIVCTCLHYATMHLRLSLRKNRNLNSSKHRGHTTLLHTKPPTITMFSNGWKKLVCQLGLLLVILRTYHTVIDLESYNIIIESIFFLHLDVLCCTTQYLLLAYVSTMFLLGYVTPSSQNWPSDLLSEWVLSLQKIHEKTPLKTRHTVDGSEIRRSPVEVGILSHYLQAFYIPGGCLGFLPSTVWLDVWGTK